VSEKDASLVQSVERLIGAAAEFGAAIARAADKTTANGREPAAGPPGETAAGAIIRHGVSTAANLVTQIAQASQSARTAAGAVADSVGAAAGDAVPAGASGPVLRPGATLRVPLSIENPGQEGAMEMRPAVRSWTLDGQPAQDLATVRFAPEYLSVAPLDFEKLTVSIELADDADAGAYVLEIALGEDAQTALTFRVIAAEPAQG
jgi:hypothetical protein